MVRVIRLIPRLECVVLVVVLLLNFIVSKARVAEQFFRMEDLHVLYVSNHIHHLGDGFFSW